jgi:hypothetical protein
LDLKGHKVPQELPVLKDLLVQPQQVVLHILSLTVKVVTWMLVVRNLQPIILLFILIVLFWQTVAAFMQTLCVQLVALVTLVLNTYLTV